MSNVIPDHRAIVVFKTDKALKAMAVTRAEIEGVTLTDVLTPALKRYARGNPKVPGMTAAQIVDAQTAAAAAGVPLSQYLKDRQATAA